MAERREVARGADRALARDAGQGVGLEQCEQPFHHVPPHSGMAAGEADHLGRHRQPDDGPAQILAQPAAVRQDQVALKLGQPVARNPGLREQPEAGIDPVDGAPARHDPPDAGGRGVDRRPGVRSELDGGSGPDGAKLGEGDGAGAEGDHRLVGAHGPTIGRSSPCSLAQSIASS